MSCCLLYARKRNLARPCITLVCSITSAEMQHCPKQMTISAPSTGACGPVSLTSAPPRSSFTKTSVVRLELMWVIYIMGMAVIGC